MDKFVSIKALDSQLEPGKTVLKASEYRRLVNYEELVKTMAQRERDRQTKATEAMANAIQSGMQQGKDQAHHQLVEQMLGFTIKMHENLREVEWALVDVVTEAVQQIIQDFDNETLVKSTVRRGLELVRGSKKLQVRVNPQMQDTVLEQLHDLQKSVSHVEVLGDSQLKLDECVLESDVGIVHASLEVQIESLIAALRKTFPRPKAPPA